jgi:hypothetical protein
MNIESFFNPPRPSSCAYLRNQQGFICASHNLHTGDVSIFRQYDPDGQLSRFDDLNLILDRFGYKLVKRGHKIMIECDDEVVGVFTGVYRLGKADLRDQVPVPL